MAKILSDREILKLIGKVLIGADKKFINPNGIELRLGKHVMFHSTDEERELEVDQFLKVNPGESVSIASLESIDFSKKTVNDIFPDKMLMAFVTPTTTMMREGISQVATKIDAGFRGLLNWGLRNGSTKELILQCGEPIFKLTIFILEENEVPKIPYGERDGDSYQDAEKISHSTRRIPAQIPKSKLISSSFDKLDPKKQLQQAGYPFDHIGRELTDLHGKFEVVSTDVRMMRDEFKERTTELSKKIQLETGTLSEKIEELRKSLLESVDFIFQRKFLRIAGLIIGAIPVMYGGVTFLQKTSLSNQSIAFISTIVGISVIILSILLTKNTH
jgi:deoxycytidine triphosphate deaminase